jgi:hypothetical protein
MIYLKILPGRTDRKTTDTSVRVAGNTTWIQHITPKGGYRYHEWNSVTSHVLPFPNYPSFPLLGYHVPVFVYIDFIVFKRSEVSTAVTMKNAVFWDVALCRFCVRIHGIAQLLQMKIDYNEYSNSQWRKAHTNICVLYGIQNRFYVICWSKCKGSIITVTMFF